MRIKSLNLACKSYRSGNPIDVFEYECEYYDKSGLCIECQDCICNFGDINPESGERINFILRAVQKRRGKKQRKRGTKIGIVYSDELYNSVGTAKRVETGWKL